MEGKRVREKGDAGRCSKGSSRRKYAPKRKHHSKKKNGEKGSCSCNGS